MTQEVLPSVSLRSLKLEEEASIEWVASRMRHTLVEVLGEEQGGAMYSMTWLCDRVRAHLDSAQIDGQVFLAVAGEERVGHTIVRVDDDGTGKRIGLFSTIYVEPQVRNRNVAGALLTRGEEWFRKQGLRHAVTYTDEDNEKLQQLFKKHGYTMSLMPKHFVKLMRALG